MRRTAPLLIALALCACDDDEKPALPSAAPPTPTGLLVADRAVPAPHILAIGTEGESSWRISVSTDPLDCETLAAAYPERPETKGKLFDFWLTQPLESDGQKGLWTFRSGYWTDAKGGRGLTSRGAELDSVSIDDSHVAIVGLEISCQDSRAATAEASLIGYHGDLRAERCPRVERSEADRPQTDLSLTIAGQSFAIRGASVHPRGKRHHLRLTRAPHVCASAFTEGYDFYLDLALDQTGDGDTRETKLAFAAMLGDIFPGEPAGSDGKESFQVSAEDALGGTGEVEISLDGKLGVSGYPVELKGKLSALRCTPVSP